MQNFNPARFKDKAVVDVQWRMLKPVDAGATMNRRAEIWKVFQQVNMIEESVGKPFTGSRMILPRPTHDLLEVC